MLFFTLGRPENRSAINCEVVCRLYDAWTQLDEGDDLRVAIFTGGGDTFPLAASSVRLRRQMPYAIAAEVLLTGEDLPAAWAFELGPIDDVVPDAQAVTKARGIAQRIADNGPLAVRSILATLCETEMLPEDEAFEIEPGYGMPVLMSEDGKAGPRAFLERRKPAFKRR